MELEEGMYVRINNNVRKMYIGIGKVVNIVNDTVYVKMSKFDLSISFEKDEISNFKNNLIDLIEEGDLLEINNEKYEVIYDKSYEKLGILIPDREQLAIRHSALEYVFKKYKISIATKEQFESQKYIVESE